MAVFGAAVVLGALAGAGLALLTPPTLRSSVAVVVWVPEPIRTEAFIAASDPVLQAASRNDPLSFQQLTHQVHVRIASAHVLMIRTKAHSAADAEAAANAVARSYVAFVRQPGYPHYPRYPLQAVMVAPATAARGTTLPAWLAGFAALGGLAGAVLCLIGAVCLSWIMRRPRSFSFGLFTR
jgi:hypothetical protein